MNHSDNKKTSDPSGAAQLIQELQLRVQELERQNAAMARDKARLIDLLDTGASAKKSEATLILQSKRLLQRVIDSIPDWVFVFDRSQRYMLVNESYAKFFKLRVDLMVGLTDAELCHVSAQDASPEQFALDHARDIAAVFDGQLIHNRRETVRVSDSESYVFDTYWLALRDAFNNIYGALCYRRNITLLARAEQEQKQLAGQLHQAHKMEMVGQFTSGIAHDFNNILASISGYAELLKEAGVIAGDPRLEKYVDQILLTGTRAHELIRNLMVLTQKTDMYQAAIDVARSIHEIVDSLRPTFPEGVAIELQIEPNLAPVRISPVQLHQVIMNLALNARDAMASQGVLRIRAQQTDIHQALVCASCHHSFAGNYVSIALRDTGSGITPEIQQRIFDPFFTTKRRSGGSGLGLSVLHGIVHSAGGHLCVSSRLSQGAEFIVYFPVSESQSQKKPQQFDG